MFWHQFKYFFYLFLQLTVIPDVVVLADFPVIIILMLVLILGLSPDICAGAI
jgi:hypothetical protein